MKLSGIISLIILNLTLNLFVWINPNPILAQNKVQVDHVATGFEKLREKLNLFLSFSTDKKITYQIFLTNKRLAELKHAIDSEQIDLIEETSSRYATYVGKLVNSIIKSKTKISTTDINFMFENHQVILETLRNKFTYDSAWWLMLQQDIDTVNIFQNKLKLLNNR